MMDGRGKSDSLVVPEKPSNKAGRPEEEMRVNRVFMYYSGRFSTGLSIPRPDIDRAAHHSGRIQKSVVRIWTAADAEEIGDDKLVALVLRLSRRPSE